MRISTSALYDQGSSKISDLQSALNNTQMQISAGKSILTPADNPIAAAQVLDVTQSQSVNAQFAVNRQSATNSLTMVDGVLSTATDLLQSLKTLTVSAGVPGLSSAARGAIAVQFRAGFDNLMSLANSTDGTGKYLFGGYHTATPPFVKTSTVVGGVTVTGAQYVGDQGQTQLQVDSSRQIAISESGPGIFQTGTQDIFKTLDNFATILENPASTDANILSGLQTANTNIGASLDNVLTARASTGSKLNELDALNSYGSDRDIQYSQTLSKLQDLDYAKAITKFSQQQTTLQAAQQSFVKMSGLSLFNYIN
ncbi:flagellar hook-associated protein FlgL [Sulfuriferula thiophila]|uniref:flagellar hook-associated protein FlgL n=1 Tax=Sulfuriferula thiophila TaxID=1781211 RepID=UPI000F608859|nr:flagellar hook-associated protein FlgL [Sulfuriferula thiophila]